MKNIVVTILTVLISVLSIAQSNNLINFVFPDAVEISIDEQLTKIEKSKLPFEFYLLLETDSNGYIITIGRYQKNEADKILRWVKHTNRYAVINNRSVPIIFDYDLKFGAPNSDEIGSFRNREGQVLRVTLLLHGTTIYFRSDGSIIRTVDW